MYHRALDFLHKCEQAGIVDPDSATQSWDIRTTKMNNEKILMTFWSWDGKLKVNSDENKAKGVGFELAPLEDQQDYVAGNMTNGNISTVIALGSKAKNKQRLVRLIDWLYSPEGIYASAAQSGSPCPQNVCWTLKDGKPTLTKFGVRAFYNPAGLNMPKSMGGGDFAGGQSGFNFQTVNPNDIDPNTHAPYNPQVWESELNKKNPLDDDWRAHMGAKTDMEYLTKHHQVTVEPGAPFAAPEEDSQTNAIRTQINSQIIQNGWKAIMDDSDAGFQKNLDKMVTTANGLGFDKIKSDDYRNIDAHVKADREIVREWKARK